MYYSTLVKPPMPQPIAVVRKIAVLPPLPKAPSLRDSRTPLNMPLLNQTLFMRK